MVFSVCVSDGPVEGTSSVVLVAVCLLGVLLIFLCVYVYTWVCVSDLVLVGYRMSRESFLASV